MLFLYICGLRPFNYLVWKDIRLGKLDKQIITISIMEEEKYERPEVQVYEAELRNGILDTTGHMDDPGEI